LNERGTAVLQRACGTHSDGSSGEKMAEVKKLTGRIQGTKQIGVIVTVSHERKNGNTIQESILIHNFEGRGGLMKKFLSILSLAAAALVPVGVSRAQLAAANETGVTMGHVHLVVQDVEAGKNSGWRWGRRP